MTNWKKEHDRLLRPAETVDREGIDTWASSYDATDREEQIRKLNENESDYRDKLIETDFGDVVSDTQQEDDEAMFEGARLLVAAADYKALGENSDMVGGNDGKDLEAVELAIEVDRYSQYISLPQNAIKRRIDERDDQVYGAVEEYIISQKDLYADAIDPQNALENDPQVRYITGRINRIRDAVKDAVITLVEENELTNIMEEIESAVLEASEASETRADVEAVLSDEIGDFEEQIQWALREQRELLLQEMQQLQGADSGAVDEHMEEIKNIVSTLDDKRTEMDRRLERLQEQQSELDDAISRVEREAASASRSEFADLVDNELEELRSLRADLETAKDRIQSERDRLSKEIETLNEAPAPPGMSEGMNESGDESVIPASVARTCELDFIARFERSVQTADRVVVPDGELADPRIDHATDNDRAELVNTLNEGTPPDAYPVRSSTRFDLYEQQLVGTERVPSIRLEALTTSRLETYAEYGRDAHPTSLGELHIMVENARSRATDSGSSSGFGPADSTHHLIVIGSPTGWSQEAISAVEEDAARFGRNVSVCLIDLHTDEPHYARGDRILERNSDLLSQSLAEERVQRCKEEIIEEYLSPPTTEFLVFKIVDDEIDCEPHILRRAFDRLEEEGHGEQEVTEQGLILRIGT